MANNFEVESNDSALTATEIEANGIIVGGQLKSAADIDWFKIAVTFQTDEGATNSIDFTFDSPVTSDNTSSLADSFEIVIYGPDGITEVAHFSTDDDISGTFSTTASGSYYVVISSPNGLYNEEDGQSLQYGLTLTTSEKYAEVESNDTPGTANAATFGREYAGQVGVFEDLDLYKYTVTNPGLVSLEFGCNGPFNPSDEDKAVYRISVYQEQGAPDNSADDLIITRFFTNDDIPNFDFYAATAGAYYVEISSGSSWYTTEVYTLKATSTGESATSDPEPTSFEGGAGNDYLLGTVGDDTLDGKAGIDTMYGSLGNDIYYVDNKKDKVVEIAGADQGTKDVIMSSVDVTLPANVEKLVLVDSAIKATGNTADNTLIGNDLNNTLDGKAGNDILDGGVGADRLIGGAGNDIYYIDDAKDIIVESGTGIDTVITSIDILKLHTQVENVTLAGETVQVIGNNLNNMITGNDSFNNIQGGKGNDTIYGLGGNDDLRGGAGVDALYGGDGNDAFVFDVTPSAANVDYIMDFQTGGDKLWLSASIFKKLAAGGVSVDNIFQYSPTTNMALQDANDYLLYDTNSGWLYYDADAYGVKAPVAFAALLVTGATGTSTPATLAASDLFVF